MADVSTGEQPRRPIMAGNWKMHHTHLEAIQVVQKLGYRLEAEDFDRCEVVVCPAFTALRSVQTVIDADRLPIGLGAQDVHWEDDGAYTGEVSAPMLAKLAVSYVIVGHSERRQYSGETDETVNRKLRAVLAHRMTPIMCVGETLAEREAGETAAKVSHQVGDGLSGVSAEAVAGMVVAYEPIWAIGTGKVATPEDANETIGAIRSMVAGIAGGDAAAGLRIQYGGSVKPGNIAALMAMPEIDGALVGGASLEADDFAHIVRWR
ncbi:MAG: triose-phosphate isomerase [Acidimicrobiia bacterium]